MKVLFYGETPVIETGAARVDRNLLDTIVALGIDVEVLGVSHFFGNEYDHERYPYAITYVDTYEDAKKAINERAGTFDVLFISADMHVPNILLDEVKKYPSIVLGAIDGPVRHVDQVTSLAVAHTPALYSRYAYNQVLKVLPELSSKLCCTPLGCEPDAFYPLSEAERRAYRLKAFGINDDTFLVMWANRNQSRKDPARAMKAFHLFHERVPNSRLYMHTKMEDVGGNVVTQAILLGLNVFGDKPEIVFAPHEYNEIYGFDREKLNKLYNAADVGISTAQGEGWGLTTTEFMTAGTPFIGPANTTFFEILGSIEGENWRNGQRGYLARSGGDDLWSVFYGKDDSPRPLTSASDLADRLYHVYTHRKQARLKAKAARAWTEKHTWSTFRAQWREILCHVQHSLPELQGKMAAI